MDVYKPLRVVLFVYELARLAVLTGIMGGLGLALTGSAGMAFPFPWLVCAVPNALFSLMAFFLWLDITRYRPYASLYTAGKIITVVTLVCWALLSRQEIITALFMNLQSSLLPAGSLLFMLLGDMCSTAGAVALIRGSDAEEAPAAISSTGDN
jgi:hypothetical protein